MYDRHAKFPREKKAFSVLSVFRRIVDSLLLGLQLLFWLPIAFLMSVALVAAWLLLSAWLWVVPVIALLIVYRLLFG